MSLPRPELVSFGSEVRGHGMIAGCGKAVIGIVRHIRALSGFHIGMFIATEDMYSFGVDGDNSARLEGWSKTTWKIEPLLWKQSSRFWQLLF
jgi:hypothetical protein